MLCTNPAALSGGTAPVTTEVPSERFPAGLIALSLTQFYAGNQPTAPTPWLQPKERFTARCVREQNTNTLRLASVGGSRQPSPSPDESWGLHIGDVNLAMGNLVELARGQSRAYLAAEARKRKAACLTRGGVARRKALGKARVGGSRTAARRVLTGRRVTGRTGVDRYCVAGGGSLRLYYPTRRSDSKTRRRLANRALLTLATSTKFSVRGIKAGTRTARSSAGSGAAPPSAWARTAGTWPAGAPRPSPSSWAATARQCGGPGRALADATPRASRALLRTWR